MSGWRRCAGLFSILPVPQTSVAVTPGEAAAALRWLPVLGAVLGAVAGLPTVAVLARHPYDTGLAAILGVGALAVLTRGLHLDGLADTADGLGSRAPAERALEIMRRSDIGPFGVMTLVIMLALDGTALADLGGGRWHLLAALAVVAATGRTAAVQAAVEGIPGARTSGFGALIAGRVRPIDAVVQTAGVLLFGAVVAQLLNAAVIAWVVAQVVGLTVGLGLRWHTTRRFGGVSGDVFGAVIEATTTATLVAMVILA